MKQKKTIMLILAVILLLLAGTTTLTLGKSKKLSDKLDDNYLKDNIVGSSEVKEEIKLLDEKESIEIDSAIVNVTTYDNKNIEVTFDKNITKVLSNMKEGNIFIMSALSNPNSPLGNGYIGKIKSINKETNTVVIETPDISEVFTELKIDSASEHYTSEINYFEAGDFSRSMRGRSNDFFNDGSLKTNNVTVSYKLDNTESLGTYFKYINIDLKKFLLSSDDKGEEADNKVYLNGVVKIEDLIVAAKVDYENSENSVMNQNDIKVSGDITSDINITASSKLKKSEFTKTLFYLGWDFGKIKIGTGNHYILAGAILSLDIDAKGELIADIKLSINNELSFSVDSETSTTTVKGINYPVPELPKDTDDSSDETIGCAVTLGGTIQANLETLIGLKARAAVFNIDLIGAKVNTGLDGSAEISANTEAIYTGDKLDIDLLGNSDIEVAANIDFVANASIYTDFLDSKKNPSHYKEGNLFEFNKELFRKNIISFELPKDKKEEAMQKMDGYWILEGPYGTSFLKSDFETNKRSISTVGRMEFESGEFKNIEYDKKTQTLTCVIESPIYDGEGKIEILNEKYKLIDDNTLEYTTNEGYTSTLKRTTYNQLAYANYGQKIYYIVKYNATGMSNAEYRNAFLTYSMHDIWIDKNKKKETLSIDKILSSANASAIGSISELDAKEVDIIPNITSYHVFNKTMANLTPVIVFEDGTTASDCVELFKKYSNLD